MGDLRPPSPRRLDLRSASDARGTKATSASCDFASQSSSLRSSGNPTPPARANLVAHENQRLQIANVVVFFREARKGVFVVARSAKHANMDYADKL
ncbi:MAG: hypothetical protein IJI35_01840, partial [Kiritimatiellae bacterium]|nr:hypothetical protein [Kiritimatiellia bacterium]